MTIVVAHSTPTNIPSTGRVAPESRRLFAHSSSSWIQQPPRSSPLQFGVAHPFAHFAKGAWRISSGWRTARSLSQAKSNRAPEASAGGAAKVSPARKRRDRAQTRLSSPVVATLPTRSLARNLAWALRLPSISAVGAAEVSPARKRWVSTEKITSAVGATLRSAMLSMTIVLVLFAVFAQPLAAQQYTVTLDPAQTTIEYTVDSTLHTVHGTFKLKSGEIHFDPSSGKASGTLVVDATSGDSGNDSRDKKMHQQILESKRYPEITFTPQKISGTFNPSATSQLELSGNFQLKGQDHPLTATIAVDHPGAPSYTRPSTSRSPT